MIWQPGTSSYLFYKPSSGGASVPAPTVYWEADSGVITTTNGTTADASPVSGNKVLSWSSKDASASVASFATNSQRPTYYNYGVGKPFIRFNGQQNQRLASTGPASAFNNVQAFTMGVAFRAAPIYAPGYRNQQYLTLDNGSANTNTLISQGGGMQFGFWSGNIGQRVLLNNTQQLWGETTHFGTYSTASSTSTPGAQSTKIYTGGTLAASNTTSTAGVSPCTSILIGGADATSGFSTICDYYGVYLYASELNATQISAVHNDISSRMFTWTTIPVAGAALWLDASRQTTLWDTTALGANVLTNGGAIGQWNDLSGNARHAQQASSANRPTWASPANGQNGLGAIVFNGTSQYMAGSYTGLPKGNEARTLIWVGKYVSANWGGGLGLGNNNSNQDFSLSSNSTTGTAAVRTYGTTDKASAINLASPFFFAATHDGSTAIIRVNTTTQSFPSSTFNTNNNVNPVNMWLGTLSGASYFANAYHFEDIVFNRALTSTELDSMQSYLKAKWGTP